MADDEPSGEYTRLRSKVQLGDGPDQRGETTVEIVREEPGDGRQRRTVTIPDEGVEGGTREVETFVNDTAFAEFYYELTRARGALSEALDLEDQDDG